MPRFGAETFTMMMRPRLARSLGLSIAVLGVLALSYFPLAHTRASNVSASILPSANKPLVNFKNTQTAKLTYTGDSGAVSALRGGAAAAVSMAAGDFNADGAIDVIAGYSTGNGGVLALMMGNPDAYAPKDTTLYQKAMKGSVPATFQSKAAAFPLPESPDLIVTGDFNRDGNLDVLVAARGNNLYFLAGDGKGGLLPAQVVSVTGQVQALATSSDGHVAVSLEGPNNSQLTILAPSASGLVEGASYNLPARGNSITWGNLGGGHDVAVGAGSNIVLIYNALSAKPQTETVTVPFNVMGLAIGDFIWDRDGREELSALADDGSIHILQHGTLNTTPLTAADIPGRRAAMMARIKANKLNSPSPTSYGAWTIASQMPYTASVPSGPVSASAFSSPGMAMISGSDLMVLDAGRSQLNILDTSGKAASPSAAISFSSAPVAAFAMPQKIDASRDMVVLTSAQSSPLLVTSNASLTFNVNTTADIDSVNACTTNVTSPPSTLSLREAVCVANNNANDVILINVPSGTYDLALRSGGETGELVLGNGNSNNISIVGGGQNSTIIQQTDGIDRVFEQDLPFVGNGPVSLSNLTIQNGTCQENGGSTNDCNFGGGGMLGIGNTGDNLTLTNVTFNNNNSGGSDDGGGLAAEGNGNLVITNCIFSNNTAPSDSSNNGAAGGSVYFDVNASDGTFTVTGSTFTGNTSTLGGGAIFDESSGDSTSISGSVFTGNSAHTSVGGGVFADDAPLTISNSRFSGNSASGGGTGLGSEGGSTVTAINNWWGCNGGPGASGCDTVFASGGTASFNPWLVLTISANSTQINTNSSTGLTATIDSNSSGGTGFSVPNGTPISFGATLGSISGASTTLTNGTGTATYNSGSTPGAGSATATVDNQEVSETINILVSVTVTTSPANLSITVDGNTATAPQTYSWLVGSSHTIATTSPQNVSGGTEQIFSSWSDGGAISHSVTAPSSSNTYTATFNTEYQLTTQASPSADGSVSPASGSYYASGTSISVTATPNTDFAFNNWTSTGGTFDSTTSASTNFHMPAAATTVTGNFIAATSQITITTSPANLLVSVDGGSFVAAPLVETWNQGSSHTIATTSPQSGGSGIQYAFTSWSDSGAISHSITVPTTASTYTASFATQYQLTTAANPSAGGTVSPPSGSYYNNGTVVPLVATANAGYTFSNWTGNVANASSATTSITMTSPQSVTANFSLIIVASPTTTSVSSSNNPSFTTAPNNSVTFTATVTSNTTVNEGTVTFSDPANDFTCSGGNTVAVSNGAAACTTSYSTEGSRVVTANYNGTVNFQTSSGFLTQEVDNHTTQNGNQFCNPSGPTLSTNSGPATPYPSKIFVSGLSGNVGAVTVNLNNISSSNVALTDLLLVGPTGAAIIPFAAVGDGSTINGVNVTLDDSASSLIPGGSPLVSGTYKPTSITGSTTLVFPAPAPLVNASNYAATDGAATLTSQFGNTAPNGTWELFSMASGANSATAITGGWCVNITSPAVQTTITTSPAGLLVSVDGGTATASPLVENWIPGSSHTIATTSPQSGAPGTQYVFSSWSDSGAISHSITVPSTATTYTASFSTQYQLTTQAAPSADGTVSPASGSYYAAGATIPVTATANAGFTFSNWTSTGGTFDSTTSASTNYHMPAAPATVTGNFGSASVQITITTNPSSLLVSVDGGTATAAPLVENWVIGSSHTIATTSPQAGPAGTQYAFSSWSDSGAISHSISVPSTATTYTASFSTQYQLSTQVLPPADGTVSPASGSYFAAGATIPVTATANSGFTFSNWTSTGGSFDSTTTASTNYHMPAAPATVTGNFSTASVQTTITTSPANLLVSVDGGAAAAAPLVESWVIGSSHTITTTSPQAGATGTQYVFSSWSDGGAISHSITVPSTATTYTASFNTQYLLTTLANPANGGTVSPITGYQAANSVVPLLATANSGFTFSSWTGNVANAGSASTSITMSSPQTVTANFTQSGPVVLLNPTTINFGTSYQLAIKSHNVTVTNTGNATLTINSISITPGAGTGKDDFTDLSFCPKNLPAGKSCTITVFFFAGNVGMLSATLNITDNAAGSPQQVSLSATVINPQAAFNPSSLHFGSVAVGHSSTKQVTLKNPGTTTLDISSVTVTGTNRGDFVANDLCGSSLAAGQSCTISVTFTPGAHGNRSASLTVMDNAQIGTQNVPLYGDGD
jgi:hypothetical protein